MLQEVSLLLKNKTKQNSKKRTKHKAEQNKKKQQTCKTQKQKQHKPTATNTQETPSGNQFGDLQMSEEYEQNLVDFQKVHIPSDPPPIK